jgi:Na+-transporting methylmalonyl-CoA/oxaloacetate decarboxylase gamma subunit
MKNLDIILAASGPEASVSTSDTLGIVVVGFLFVMVVLSLLSIVTAIIGTFFKAHATREAAKEAARIAALPPVPEVVAPCDLLNLDSNPAIFAVVAAAVHAVIGDRPHRVVSIREGAPGWAQEGRREIFSSHRVR